MDELMDMISMDQSPSQISDKIKEVLFAKASEKVDNYRSTVSANIFNSEQDEE